MLLDPKTLEAIIPGCHRVEKLSDTHFRAEVTLGVGPVTGRYKADITLSDFDPPKVVTLTGVVVGVLGDGRGSGRITLTPSDDGGTLLAYKYDADIGGKVAAIGGRLLDGAAKIVIRQFFTALARHTGGQRKARPVRPLFGSARMKPARFDYIRAETLAEAHAALAEEGGDARVIAGGQSLLPMLSMRLARPRC